MERFKIRFPSGYRVDDIYNDNLDVNVYLENGKVYFATVFTICNIQDLMNKEKSDFFWSTDMIVVRDVAKTTIRSVVEKTMEDGYFNSAFCEINNIEEIYEGEMTFEDLNDETF